tara:strand:+ start:5926 stop:6657 length:732 start_codon:yes stop_codon:yes gene_type:complete
MINEVFFLKIKFSNYKLKDFNKLINKRGLFLFPSGPGLSTIKNNKKYCNALQQADVNFFDSGYFVLLLRYLKNIKVNKFSGYLFIKCFLEYLKKNKIKVLSIDPNKIISTSVEKLLLQKIINKNLLINYIAPIYDKYEIIDIKLLKIIKKTKPRFVLINIAGGTQEILGLYLKKNLNYKPTILCTGAAITFFTGVQAPISPFLDKIFLGWFTRILYNPKLFLLRYVKSFKLIFIVQKNKITFK